MSEMPGEGWISEKIVVNQGEDKQAQGTQRVMEIAKCIVGNGGKREKKEKGD